MLSLDVVAKNEVIIEGTLLEMDLREGTIEKRWQACERLYCWHRTSSCNPASWQCRRNQ